MSAAPVDLSDRHLIIGAGFSGLGVAAAFKRSAIAFDAVEADDDVGGNWYHGVYETTHIISSRKTTEYKDWPMPADWPDFPSAAQMLSYLRGYADHFGLRAHIAFNTKVTLVEPAAEPGLWRVTLERHGQAPETRLYGGVVVANGHHWDRRWPEYPGTLSIPKIHSKDYKTHHILDGKRVLVIGGGNSACDIAVEAARFGKASHVSMRRGYWFLPKTMLGVPTAELMKGWMPRRAQRAIIKGLVRVVVGPYENYGLAAPDHEPFEHHPTINSELLNGLRHGRITAHPDVRRWDGNVVEFVDGRREELDLVVCATGYHLSFPFLAPGIVEIRADGMPNLIGGICPPAHKNIYLFGVGQPRYGAGPLITAGAATLCTMVETQAQLEHPLGEVMRRLGAKPPKTHLQDPFAILRGAKIGQKLLPRLPAIEPWIMRNQGSTR